MEEFLTELLYNNIFRIIIIVVIFDTIFGVLRAIKEKKLNSCVGIDGLVRKSGMILSSLFFFIIDDLIDFNLIGFIPEEILNYVNIKQIGIGELFGILYIVFEFLSVLKNLYKCKIPIPKKLKTLLEKILADFTEEIKLEGDKENGKEANKKTN